MKPIKVGILEDESTILESMKNLVSDSEGFECVCTFGSAEEALKGISNAIPDVMLTDIHLPGISGIDFIEKVRLDYPGIQFIICTSYEDTDTVFKALKAGAIGYLVKTAPTHKLLEAITDAFGGGSPMSGHIARKVVKSFDIIQPNPELQKLSQRETEILTYLSKGLRYKEIANILFVSNETVRTHVRNIYQKLQVNSRTEALNKTFNR